MNKKTTRTATSALWPGVKGLKSLINAICFHILPKLLVFARDSRRSEAISWCVSKDYRFPERYSGKSHGWVFRQPIGARRSALFESHILKKWAATALILFDFVLVAIGCIWRRLMWWSPALVNSYFQAQWTGCCVWLQNYVKSKNRQFTKENLLLLVTSPRKKWPIEKDNLLNNWQL